MDSSNVIQGLPKKTTHLNVFDKIRNFRQILKVHFLGESQINYSTFGEKMIEIDALVSDILMIKVSCQIFQLNRKGEEKMTRIARLTVGARVRARFSPFLTIVPDLRPNIPLSGEQKITTKH